MITTALRRRIAAVRRARRSIRVVASAIVVMVAFASGYAFAGGEEDDVVVVRPIRGRITVLNASRSGICVTEPGGKQTCSSLLRREDDAAVELGQDITGVVVRVRRSADVREDFIILTRLAE